MATGGIPLARVFVILVLFAVPAAVFTVDNPALAQGSEAANLLKKGLEQVRAGNFDEGIGTLQQALAADPSNEEVMAALGRAEYESLLALIASGQAGANVASALLDRATPILPEKAFNESELKNLVKTAVTDKEYTNRFDAAVTLSRVYGEFAVPGLVDYLSSSNTEYRVQAHITLRNRIGRDAVLPLNEALGSGNANVRRMVAAQLGAIGDARSLAALAEAASGDSDESARAEAAKAFAALQAKFGYAAEMGAAGLYLRLAQLYYGGDYRVLAYTDRPLVVWSWGKDGLVNQPVPRHLYVLKLAEEAAYDALRLDPSNPDARALLARILASEKLASDVVSAVSDDDLTKQFAAGLADAGGTVAALGWDTLAQAVGDALDQHDQAAGAFLLGVMPWVYGSSDFTTDNPVVRGTSNAAANVRLAAAEAVLRFNGTRRITAFPDPDGFIGLVAKSVGEVIPRQILVVDGNDARRNKILTELNAANYTAFDARTGSDGVVRALRYSGLDLIVVSSDLVDMEALAAISKLQSEDRTKNIPVVVVGTADQAADQKWRNVYKDKAKALAGIPEGPGLASQEFRKLIADSFGSESPSAAARYAKSARILAALAGTDTDNALFNWNALTPTLAALLGAELPDEPPVRLNAINAMGNIGDAGAIEALVSFFGSSGDDAQRAAAGHAIASICRRGEVVYADDAFQTLLKGTQATSADVRTAAFAALGSANLSPDQSMAVATTNRPGAASGEAESMEEEEE